MPSSYVLYEMTQFPRVNIDETVAVMYQMPLIEGVEAPQTYFKLRRQINELHVDVFWGLHEVLERREGRAKDVKFTEFIAPYYFPVYYHQKKKVLMLKVRKDVARGAMKLMLEKVPEVQGGFRKTELQSIQAYIERFKGAWFRVADSADVSSQALFGPSVDKDMRFARASEEGEIFYIRMDYPFADRHFHIGISDDYSLVIFDSNLDENFELELILDVKETLLDRARLRQNSG